MSIMQTTDGKLEDFWVTINGQHVAVDHILQTSFYTGVGILGEPGRIVITAQAFRLLDASGMGFNPVGKTIEIMLQDPKVGQRPYSGLITSMKKLHAMKQDCVVLGFDKEHWLKIHKAIWFKAFEKKNILEITKEFFESNGIPFNEFPSSHHEFRGTFWENFATPINGPTLPYLLEELSKDNFIVYANPEDGGVVIVNWLDLLRLNEVNKNYPDYVVDETLAKFDTRNDEWKQNTFIFGKQIDTGMPFKIQRFHGAFDPELTDNENVEHVFFSGLKKPLAFNQDTDKLEPNEIGYEKVEEYPGKDFESVTILPYPSLKNLVNIDGNKTDYGHFEQVTQSITHPRYMFYRMQQSYARKIKLTPITIHIPGSVKMIAPLSTVPISYFENARVADPESPADGDIHYSGLFMIWASGLHIIGPNALMELSLVKPYH